MKHLPAIKRAIARKNKHSSNGRTRLIRWSNVTIKFNGMVLPVSACSGIATGIATGIAKFKWVLDPLARKDEFLELLSDDSELTETVLAGDPARIGDGNVNHGRSNNDSRV